MGCSDTSQKSIILTLIISILISSKYGGATSNPPTITFDKQYANLPENSTKGTVITRVTATGRNGNTLYIMSANQDTQDLVDINILSSGLTTTAEIKLKGTLDRETLSQRTLILKACDCPGCRGCIAATKDFTIFVTDVNDEAPVFQNLPYQCEIPENADVNTTINASIKAVDRDNGLGGQVRYYLKAKALYNGAFSIGIYSGILEIQRNLDYETLSFYQYTVTAAGDILQIKASDGDTGVPNQIEYRLENGSKCSNFFEIDTKSGIVTAKGELDRDSGILKQIGGYCMMSVTAFEVGQNIAQFGRNTSTTPIYINVEDVNDNKPQFEYPHYYAHVREGIANIPITVSGQWIKVHDDDQGKNSHFNLTVLENGREINFLKASPPEVYGSGDILIRLTETFRFEYGKTKNISIEVVATEMDTPEHYSASCNIDISIIDVKGPIIG